MPLIHRYLFEEAEVAIWKIEEEESFFREATGLVSLIHSDKRRIEYYAGRYLLTHVIPNLNLDDIKIDRIGKPYLPGGEFHFSISHSFPYVAVAVHTECPIGVDIQVYRDKITRIAPKFLSDDEMRLFAVDVRSITLLWSAKEAMFKWRGTGGQQFNEQLMIRDIHWENQEAKLRCEVIDLPQKKIPLTVQGRLAEEFAIAVTYSQLD